MLRIIRLINLRLQKRKFQLVYEHNLVEAMKKYVPNKEEFKSCLRVAKKQTLEDKRTLYKTLLKYKIIKRESEEGFEFKGVNFK